MWSKRGQCHSALEGTFSRVEPVFECSGFFNSQSRGISLKEESPGSNGSPGCWGERTLALEELGEQQNLCPRWPVGRWQLGAGLLGPREGCLRLPKAGSEWAGQRVQGGGYHPSTVAPEEAM